MRLQRLACLCLLAVATGAAAADPYLDIDRVRAGRGACAVPVRLPPLVQSAALERAAADMARGFSLQRSLDRAGYRSTRSGALTVSGVGAGDRAIEMLARKRLCPQLTEAALTEVGIYREARLVWIVLAAPFAPAVGTTAQAAGQRVLELVNRARATPRRCGNTAFDAARPLRWNDRLAESSRLHSEDMANYNYFSHNGRDGSDPSQRVERAGYNYRSTGENIAAGYRSAEETVAGWIKSPGHCANLMDPVFTEMGAAVAINARSDMGVYWTQEFGTRR